MNNLQSHYLNWGERLTRMAATRDGYGDALPELAVNEKAVVLEADLEKSTNLFTSEKHPERTVSCGIGEQNMLLVAAGLVQWLHTVC